MKTVFALILALVLTVVPAHAGNAIVVISYSDPEEVYGWCSTDGSDYVDCAYIGCLGAGGTECTDTVFCSLAYAFIAFSRSGARGMATSCDDDATTGRLRALTACSISSNALCWTREQIGIDGTQMSAEENLVSDRAVYMQVMLQGLGLSQAAIDLEPNPGADEGLRTFQTRAGLEPTALWNTQTFDAMFAVYDGEHGLLATLDANLPAIVTGGQVTALSNAPFPDHPYLDEFAGYAPARQAVVLGMLVRYAGYPCPTPLAATKVNDISWSVECSNAVVYPLERDEDSWGIILSLPTEPPPPVAPTKEKKKK